MLPDLLTRRRALKADHLMLLSKPNGKAVSATALRDRYEAAREKAAAAAEKAGDKALAADIRAMYLRDMRKRAADLAGDVGEAQGLLQHGSASTTQRHYRTKAVRLKPVR